MIGPAWRSTLAIAGGLLEPAFRPVGPLDRAHEHVELGLGRAHRRLALARREVLERGVRVQHLLDETAGGMRSTALTVRPLAASSTARLMSAKS